MDTNQENNNELGNPTSFGVVLGLLVGVIIGPAGAIIGFIAGAALGFWYNKKQDNSTTSSGEGIISSQPKKHSHIHCNH